MKGKPIDSMYLFRTHITWQKYNISGVFFCNFCSKFFGLKLKHYLVSQPSVLFVQKPAKIWSRHVWIHNFSKTHFNQNFEQF